MKKSRLSHAINYVNVVYVTAAGFEDKTAYAQCIFAYTPGTVTLVPVMHARLKLPKLKSTVSTGSL